MEQIPAHKEITLAQIEKLITFLRKNYKLLVEEADQNAFKDIVGYLETAKVMADDNKRRTCLYDAATKYVNQLAFRLYTEDKFDEELTKVFRSFEPVKQVLEYAQAYTEEDKARADAITKAQKDYMAEREPFEIFRAVIGGMSEEEAKRKQAEYNQRKQEALRNAGQPA